MREEPAIGWAMVNTMMDELRQLGYEVRRPPVIRAAVSNLERISADEYRADIEVLHATLGRITVRRVYAQLVTSDDKSRWMLKWPRRHKEGSPHNRNQEWVITAAMSGQFADAALAAIESAIATYAASSRD